MDWKSAEALSSNALFALFYIACCSAGGLYNPRDSCNRNGHCAAACYCACHLPVTMQPLQLHHAPVMSRLVTGEPFTFLPEVYLPRFIPPQNLA